MILAAGIDLGQPARALPPAHPAVPRARGRHRADARSSALAGALQRHRALTDTPPRFPSGVRRRRRRTASIVDPVGSIGGISRIGDIAAGLAQLRRLFPQLSDAGFAETWSGWVDLSRRPISPPRRGGARPAGRLWPQRARPWSRHGARPRPGATRARVPAEDTPFPAPPAGRMTGRPARACVAAAAAATIRRIEQWQAGRPFATATVPSRRNGP